MHSTITIDGIWQVRAEGMECIGEAGYALAMSRPDGWLDAVVPGEIHLDLIRAGRMPEPSVSNNAPECRWPETHSWWFSTTFSAHADLLAAERRQLIFDGLDLNAQVFVNSQLVGSAANAFVPAIFDVAKHLVAGDNELVVRLTAGSELADDATPPGQDMPATPNPASAGAVPNPARGGDDIYGHRIWPGKKWLRKPQFTYGWDWVDALPNIGIWRGVRLEGRSLAVIEEMRLDTVIQGDRVFLELEAVIENLHAWSERRAILTVDILPPNGGISITRRYELEMQPGRVPVRDIIEIAGPLLWWPNGMGDQPLYTVTGRIADLSGDVFDRREFQIGIRTVDIDRRRLSEGTRFCVRVNGQDVFCRGANIGPHDMIPARISDAKYEALVAEAKNANMNMLRINGCSIYEAPAFYDACDRSGILVWQDFMLTCTTYPDDDAAFAAAVQSETEAVVKLLRSHPSIAFWCGNNECTWGFRDWWNPDKTRPLDIGGHTLYNQVIPDVCRLLDPHRPYWTSSPAGGDEPNSELAGDCHWWHPSFMNPDMNRRISLSTFDDCRARFVSEYGIIGPCHIDSICEYLKVEEMRPDAVAWRVHTNTFESETVPAAIGFHYADIENLPLPDYIMYGQMFQAISHGNAMEALRFRKNDPADDCQGALIWSYSDCWGETGWSILDYYLRRKASYYAFKRACAPLKVIARRRGERIVTRLVNDTRESWRCTVRTGWWSIDGDERDVTAHETVMAPNSMIEVTSAPIGTNRDPRHHLYAALLEDSDGVVIDQSLLTLVPHRELILGSSDIAVTALNESLIEVRSPVYCHGVHVEDHGRELVSDNWFDLLPNLPRRVKVAPGVGVEKLAFRAIESSSRQSYVAGQTRLVDVG